MVLRGGTDHGGPADIDIFDAGLPIGAARDGLAEGIEVHGQEIDGADPEFLHGCSMALQIPAAKQSAVNLRVKSLHAPVEDLGKARMLGDVNYRQSDVPQHLRRTARRENLDAAGSQCPAKVV